MYKIWTAEIERSDHLEHLSIDSQIMSKGITENEAQHCIYLPKDGE